MNYRQAFNKDSEGGRLILGAGMPLILAKGGPQG